MKHPKLLLSSGIATAALLITPVAFAQHGGSGTSDSSTTTSQNSGSGSGGSLTGVNPTQTPKSPVVANDDNSKSAPATPGAAAAASHESLHAAAETLLTQERQSGQKQHTEVQRQKACVAHQAELTTRSANYAAAAQRHLDTFNSIFTKVQAFQANKQLPVANYDSSVAIAKTKQTAAQAAVDALKALNVKIDCTQPDPASSVATLKTAVKTARTTLQDYRTAIKNIVVALMAASPDKQPGGTQ